MYPFKAVKCTVKQSVFCTDALTKFMQVKKVV
jgi:hypothetical protein